MWEIILSSLFLTGLAWLAGQFFGVPFRRFFRLRTKARETMDLTANVSNRDIEPAKYDDAAKALRSVGVQIGALHETSPSLATWALKRLGYDLPGAGGALIGISNFLGDKTGQKAQCRYDAEVALKLTPSNASRPVPRD